MKRPRTIAPPGAGASARAEINVTPLVDVVLVLLIIFMVVTPLLEKDIGVSLPDTEKVETTTEVPPDQLVVRIAPDGSFQLNGEPIAREAYRDALRVRLAKIGNPNDRVAFFVADDAAPYGALVAALDGAKQAGARTLGMATTTPEAPPAQP